MSRQKSKHSKKNGIDGIIRVNGVSVDVIDKSGGDILHTVPVFCWYP